MVIVGKIAQFSFKPIDIKKYFDELLLRKFDDVTG